MSLDVRQLLGVAQLQSFGTVNETVAVETEAGGGGLFHKKAQLPPPPPSAPEKITVSASVQCAFQIQ